MYSEKVMDNFWDYSEKHNIIIEGLEKPVNDIAEIVEDEEY